MNNILYHIGFDKESIIFFSKESNVFLKLKTILEKVNSDYSSKLINMESFKVNDLQEVKLILSELEKNLFDNIEELGYSSANITEGYIDYLKRMKKNLLGKRDVKSKNTRSLIKLYITLNLCVSERKEIEFLTHDSSEFFMW